MRKSRGGLAPVMILCEHHAPGRWLGLEHGRLAFSRLRPRVVLSCQVSPRHLGVII